MNWVKIKAAKPAAKPLVATGSISLSLRLVMMRSMDACRPRSVSTAELPQHAPDMHLAGGVGPGCIRESLWNC
jgi:hypothetical protein